MALVRFSGPPSLPVGGGAIGGKFIVLIICLLVIGLFSAGIFTYVATPNQGNIAGNFTKGTTITTGSNHGASPSNLAQGLGAGIPVGLAFLIFEEKVRRGRKRRF